MIRMHTLSSDYVDVKYGLEEAIKYTPVVEVADTSNSKSNTKNSTGKSSSSPRAAERRAVQMTERSDRDPEAFPPSAQIANYAVQFVGNRYVYGGTSLDKRNRLLRIHDVRHGEVWCFPAA